MSRVTSSSSSGVVSIQDTNGNPLTSTGGSLNVNITGSGGAGTVVYNYNEITSVPPAVESTIVSYSVNPAKACYLQIIEGSGGNIGQIRIYRNASVMDKKYLYYTHFNLDFDYRTAASTPGLLLTTGDVIAVKGLNTSIGNCNFNAKIQIIEVG